MDAAVQRCRCLDNIAWATEHTQSGAPACRSRTRTPGSCHGRRRSTLQQAQQQVQSGGSGEACAAQPALAWQHDGPAGRLQDCVRLHDVTMRDADQGVRLHLLHSRGSGGPFHCATGRHQSAEHDVFAKL